MKRKLKKRAEKIAELYADRRGKQLRKDYVKALIKKGLISDVDPKGV